MKVAIALVLFSSLLCGADATGTWSGQIVIDRGSGRIEHQPVLVVLKVSGGKITGTAGPNESDQLPITAHEPPGEWLTFAVNSETRYDLRIDGDSATGFIHKHGQPERHKLTLKRK